MEIADHRDSFDNIIEWGLAAFMFLLPIVYSPVSFDAYGLPRLALLRSVSLILGLVWLIKLTRTARLRVLVRPIMIPLGLYLLVSFLSTLASIHFLTSLYGNFSRYEGLLTIVNYAFLLVLAANSASNPRYFIRLFRATFASAALVSIFGSYQFLTFGMRASSTFSNPDFLGYYLALILPVGIALVFLETDWRLRLFWSVVSTLSFASLVVTFSRGAWLGFLVSMVCFGLMFRSSGQQNRESPGKSERSKVWLLSLVVFFLLAGGAIYYLSRSSSEETSIRRRLGSVVQLTGGTIGARIELWRSAISMIADRPVLGWGPDTLGLIYPRYKSLKFIRLEGSDVTPDKTHNELLQVSATIGLVGLAAYIWFLVALFLTGYSSFRNLNSRDLKVTAAAALASGAGYMVAVQFLFSEISFAPFFWIMMGLVLAAGRADSLPLSAPPVDIPIPRRVLKFKRLLLGLVILVISFFLLNDIRSLLADFYVQRAKKSVEEALAGRAVSQALSRAEMYQRRVVDLRSTNPFYFLSFASGCLQVARESGNANLLSRAIEDFEKAISINGRIPEAYLGLGDSYFLIAQEEKDERPWRQAEQAYQQVIKLDSLRAVAYLRLGQLFLEQKELKKAVPYFRKAMRIDFRYAQKSLSVANGLQKRGRLTEAELVYRELVSWNPKDTNAANDLAVLWAQTGRLDQAVGLWKKALIFDPSNSEIFFNLGLAYERKGRKDLALQMYRKALDIDATDRRARDSLERLESD